MPRALLSLVACVVAISCSGCSSPDDVSYTCTCVASLPNDGSTTLTLSYCGPDDAGDNTDAPLAKVWAQNECRTQEPTAAACGCSCTTDQIACSPPTPDQP
jgi:hypothetical protein